MMTIRVLYHPKPGEERIYEELQCGRVFEKEVPGGEKFAVDVSGEIQQEFAAGDRAFGMLWWNGIPSGI